MKQHDVFISYAHADKKYVDMLCKSLHKYGLDIFRDDESIGWGDKWADVIARGLQNCEFGIVVISKNYRGRKWTEKELAYLLSRQSVQKDKLILPILYDISVQEFCDMYPDINDIQARSSKDFTVAEISREFIQLLIQRMRSLSQGESLMVPKLSEDTVSVPGVVDNAYSKLSAAAKAVLFSALHYDDVGIDIDKNEQPVKELIQYGFVDAEDIAYRDAWFLAEYIIDYFAENPVDCDVLKNGCDQNVLAKYMTIAEKQKSLFSTDEGVSSIISKLSKDAINTLSWFLVSGGDFLGDQPVLPGMSELEQCKLLYKCDGIYYLRESFATYACNAHDFISDLQHMFDLPVSEALDVITSELAKQSLEVMNGYKLKSIAGQMAKDLRDGNNA